MAKPIYVVGSNGNGLKITDGKIGIAIRPAAQGEKQSWTLLDTGRMIALKGLRINGIGVERFVANLGFVKATPGDLNAECLADQIAVNDGLALVERASTNHAHELQRTFGGLRCTYVPFSANDPIAPAIIAPDNGMTCMVLGLGSGVSAAAVQVRYIPNDPTLRSSSIETSMGWIVGPEGDPAAMPRLTEYGGLIEHASFAIANCGLTTLVPPYNLESSNEPADIAVFAGGQLRMNVNGTDDDYVIVGCDGLDQLTVQYLRSGEVIVQRSGLEELNGRLSLGSAIGSIAAVIVKVAELDAKDHKKQKKAA